MSRINIGRKRSGGIYKGLFGNPVREHKVTEQYRTYLRKVIKTHPIEWEWLKSQIKAGRKLYCPGCGFDSPTCHARIIEEEANRKESCMKVRELIVLLMDMQDQEAEVTAQTFGGKNDGHIGQVIYASQDDEGTFITIGVDK